MIYAIGHDIVDNARMECLVNKYGGKFAAKILSPSELLIYDQHADKARYIAKRFAAKEAFAKACGTGIRNPILLPLISIMNDALGKPVFQFSHEIQQWLADREIIRSHLSISDEALLSSAFVVLECT